MITQTIHTLRDFWNQDYCDPDDLAPATIRAYRGALNHWDRAPLRHIVTLDDGQQVLGDVVQHKDGPARLGDVPLFELEMQHVKMFRQAMEHDGQSPQNQQKQWRHVNVLLKTAHEQGLIPVRPVPSIRSKSNILIKKHRKLRETKERLVTNDEVELLFRGCPNRDWKIALYLLWSYVARTEDALFLYSSFIDQYGERQITIDLDARLLRFEASKTSKLQGLPLTDFAAELLGSLKPHKDGRLLDLPTKAGCYNRRRRRWEYGYTTVWRRDICLANGIVPHDTKQKPLPKRVLSILPPDPVPTILMKNLRQTAITQLNDLGTDESGRPLGSWAAAHYIPGTTAQNYDMPTEAIRKAFERREREMLPSCFLTLAGPG